MISLSIYCSTQTMSVALYKGKILLAILKKKITKNKIDYLPLLVEKLLFSNNTKSIDRILFCRGPGSYTANRSVKALAQGLSLAKNSKLVTLDNFEVYLGKLEDKYNEIIVFFRDYNDKFFMLGRGTVLHITPSNVPMNFSYSLAFGLLSGNNNIVRLPSRNFIQVKLFCDTISKIFKQAKFLKIKKKICLIHYNNSDEISSELSKSVDARLIWGGDETIKKFKSYFTLPRCVDLSFSNRYSISCS